MMVPDANWADEIRDQRPETGRWHYVEYRCRRRAMTPRAIVRATIAWWRRSTRRVASWAIARRPADARGPRRLRFLIHFVADMHQPLHAVDNRRRGGKPDLCRRSARQRTNLHQIWDTDVVQALGADPRRIADELERG